MQMVMETPLLIVSTGQQVHFLKGLGFVHTRKYVSGVWKNPKM